jgi:hypothetical protein
VQQYHLSLVFFRAAEAEELVAITSTTDTPLVEEAVGVKIVLDWGLLLTPVTFL